MISDKHMECHSDSATKEHEESHAFKLASRDFSPPFEMTNFL